MDTGIGSSLYIFSGSTSPTNGSLLQDSNMSIQIESSASGSSINQFMQTVKENISVNNNNNTNSNLNSASQLFANIQQQFSNRSDHKNYENSFNSDMDRLDVDSESTLVTEQTPATVRDNNGLTMNSSSNFKKYPKNNCKSDSNNEDGFSEADTSTFGDSEINSIRTEEFCDIFNSQYRTIPFLKLNETSEFISIEIKNLLIVCKFLKLKYPFFKLFLNV